MIRIKERSEDFFVRELKDLKVKEGGRFAYFLLRKKGLTTVDAIRFIAKRLGVSERDIGFGGLKDKNALTEQFISVENLKSVEEIKTDNLELSFLGYGDEPISLGKIEGNYFEITARGVGRKKRQYMERMLEFIRKYGFENYFGEQRFGSVKYAKDFIVKYLLKHDYEGAVKEYLTSLKDRKRKKALLKLWGRWKDFIKIMPKGSEVEEGLVRSLMKGETFKDALIKLPKNIKLMFSFTYQSYLWNSYLNLFVRKYFKHCSVSFLKWRLSFITEMRDEIFEEIKDLEIPFLGTDFKSENKKIELIIREVFESEGITPSVLKAERIGLKLFTDGKRRAFVYPKELKILDEREDSIKLSFILPPGSYATILLRKLFCSQLNY